jgi:D-alanine-D-alanine ligase
MTRLRVAVLIGGPSPERDVSLATGQQIVAALDRKHYDILPIEVAVNGRWLPRPDLLRLPHPASGNPISQEGTMPSPVAKGEVRGAHIAALRPSGALDIERVMEREQVDVAVIAMHAPYGEDGTIQGLLEMLGMPYTGSGVLASALAMDKLRSRQIFEWHRIPVPAYCSITEDRWRDRARVHHDVATDLGYPCVVKPNAQGSSVGVSIVRDPSGLDPAIDMAFGFGPVVLVEEYIEGMELACSILDDPDRDAPMALPLIEIVPHHEFYSYDAKYAPGGSEHIIPARLPEDVTARAQALAVRAHQALGCEGMSRVDLLVHGTDIVVLEVNTIPGMTPTSLLPDGAKAVGITFPELLDRLIQHALRRARTRGEPRMA